ERRGAVGRIGVGGGNRAVPAVGDRDVGSRRQADRRVLHIGGGQRRVRLIRARGKAARQRQQMLAFGVEDVLLLAVQLLDGKPIHRQLGVPVHPLLNGRQR